MLLRLQTAHPGHLEIDDQALGNAMRQCRKKILSRFECLYTEGARPKQPTQSPEHGPIIINYGNPGGSFRHEKLWRRNWSLVELTVGPIRPDLGLLRHADEICHRTQAHFLHHPAAMDLDRLFDRAPIAGNLLVEPPRDNVRKYFPLARGQGAEFRLDRLQFGETLAVLRLTFFGTPYGFEQISVLRGFREKIYGACLHGAHTRGNVTFAGYENDRPMRAPGGQRLLEFEAIEARHRNIQHGTARNSRIVLFEKFLRAHV